jgi:hypothetical protein
MIRKRAREFGAANAERLSRSTALVMHDESIIAGTEFLHDLARFYDSLDLPRRAIPDWIVDQLSSWPGGISEKSNRDFAFDDDTVDAAFNNDGSFRWLSKFADERPRQRAQARIIERLKVMAVAAAIHEHLEMVTMRTAGEWLVKHHPMEATGEFDPNAQRQRHRFCRHAGPRGFTSELGWNRMVARMEAIMAFAGQDSDSWVYEFVLPFLQDSDVRTELGW